MLDRDPERAQDAFGDDASAGVPRVRLAPVAAVCDEHAERDVIELRERDDAVHRAEEAVVLHEEDMWYAGEVRSGCDTDRFFLLRHLDQRHVRLFLDALEKETEPRLGQCRHGPNAGGLDALEDGFAVLVGNGHRGSNVITVLSSLNRGWQSRLIL